MATMLYAQAVKKEEIAPFRKMGFKIDVRVHPDQKISNLARVVDGITTIVDSSRKEIMIRRARALSKGIVPPILPEETLTAEVQTGHPEVTTVEADPIGLLRALSTEVVVPEVEVRAAEAAGLLHPGAEVEGSNLVNFD